MLAVTLPAQSAPPMPPSVFGEPSGRNIGPYGAGCTKAASGYPFSFYIGMVNGGVCKTSGLEYELEVTNTSLLGTILYGTNAHWVRGESDYSFAITSSWEVRLISEVETESRAKEFFVQNLRPRQRDLLLRLMEIFTGKKVGPY